MCGAEAKASHLAWQRSVSIAAILSIKSCRVVVLSVPCSVAVSMAVAVVGSGVSVIQVRGLGSLRGLVWLRGLGFGGVRRFTAVTAIAAGDGTEILKRKKTNRETFKKLKEVKHHKISTVYSMEVLQKQTNMDRMVKNKENVTSKEELLTLGGRKKGNGPITECPIMFWFRK